MADLLTTLHPINDDTTDLYPNVKRDNLPQSVKDELDAIPNKVDKVQGKGLSTNDFTNADKALVDTIPDKVDKVNGKGLSTNDYTNEDKALVDTIPDKVDKVQGKGLSTNDYTNADKNAVEVAIPLKLSFLNTNILDLYRMVIRSGGMITVTDASVALASQPFPLTISPKALLNYVGGMCQKVGDSIITAPVTTVVSKGFNLWDEEWELGTLSASTGAKASSSNDIRSKNYISVKPNTTYYCNTANNIFFYDKNKGFISYKYVGTETFTTPPNTYYIMFTKGGTTYNHDICINISNASLNGTYKPYSAPVYYPIHRNILALEGYGYGLSADCYNYIDFEGKKFVKKVISYIFTGNENWIASGNAYFSIINGLSDVVRRPTATYINFSWQVNDAGLVATNANDLYAGTATTGVALNTSGNLWISASDYANRANLVGKTIYFELATPVETDISDLLRYTFPTYDIINVLPGGYLEFENENNIGVPYSVTYQSKPDAQTTVRTIASTAISEVDSNDPTNSL